MTTDHPEPTWTRDPTEFPTLRVLSPAFFLRRVPVYTGRVKPQLQFMGVEMGPRKKFDEEQFNALWAIDHWNLQWEAGPYRSVDHDELPAQLRFLKDLEAANPGDKQTELVLVPYHSDDVYPRWSPLYHLLPRRTLAKHGLPTIGRGMWPLRGVVPGNHLPPTLEPAFEQAFARHIWWHGVGRSKSPLGGFSDRDPLRLLAHDLTYWRGHMEILLREYGELTDRVAREEGDCDAESIGSEHDDLRYEMPRKGMDLWTGEDAAAKMTEELIEIADERSQLRALMDAIRTQRVEEDFSPRWSAERVDFERKLYRKRGGKIHVSFLEVEDTLPFHDADAELHDGMLYRHLLSVVDPKDRRVVVCLRKGMTRIGEIAKYLGHRNHSPISKRLARIRKKAARLLD